MSSIMRSRLKLLGLARGGFHRYGLTPSPSCTARSAVLLLSTPPMSIRGHKTSSTDDILSGIDTDASPPPSSFPGMKPFVMSEKERKLSTAENIIDYEFYDPDLLWEALQAPGSTATTDDGRSLIDGNKRLASLGDAVITLVVKERSYTMGHNIGLASNRLQLLASNFRFASLCEKAGLLPCITANISQPGFISPKTRADTIEAIVGAVYFDSGLDSATSVMQAIGIIDPIEEEDEVDDE